MFLFIHGVGATRTLWLSQIRAALGFGSEIDDKTLIDLFTISLPGHPSNDSSFTIQDCEKSILEFETRTRPLQKQIALKMSLTHRPEIIKSLIDPKLIIVGHSLGAVIAIDFSLKYNQKVKKLIIISCGTRFSKWSIGLFFDIFIFKFLVKINRQWLSKIQKKKISLRHKILLDILLENSKHSGLKSGLKITKQYDFEKLFQQLSLNQQLDFLKIPVLAIQGRYDLFNSINSSIKLENLVDHKTPIFQTKKTILDNITPTNHSNFSLKIYKTGHYPMDDDLVRFVLDTQEFLRK